MHFSLSPRVALAAIAPVLAAAAIAVPCACPDHDRGIAVAAAAHRMTPAEHAAMTAEASERDHAPTVFARHDHDQTQPAARAASGNASRGIGRERSGAAAYEAAGSGTAGSDSAPSESASFHVGTRDRPLVAEGPTGPLWTPPVPDAVDAPPHAMHAVADGSLPAPADAATGAGALAERAALTTAQATKKLSRKCQKLLKTKNTRGLSKSDKKRRTKCMAQRRALMEAAPVVGPDPGAPSTGVAAPEPAIKGPAPAAPTPTPTPGPGQTPAPTPSPTPAPSGIDPSTVPCALGVTALDVDPLKPFKMTRGVACVDEHGELAIEMVNSDRQMHNLGIRTPGQPDTLVPLLLSVPMGERDTVTAKLAPGTYEIVCMVTGHGNMTVTLTVLSKNDFIAQGYAG